VKEAEQVLSGARPQLNPKHIKGEPGTGFEKAGDLGEFECGNCRFFDPKSPGCRQPDMMAKSKQPRLKDGRVQVEHEDCCEYVDRVGRKDNDADDEK
jgi:hypothetical protein